eukprot:5403629-Amphidinium_carterae.1
MPTHLCRCAARRKTNNALKLVLCSPAHAGSGAVVEDTTWGRLQPHTWSRPQEESQCEQSDT